ncbi:ANTAR domain-containing protein [Nocardioides sp. MAHUQ-72]|uniref:ANTAR domain-containing protein n=1 Tax=unclassified Nocardioides TaxID=2615069 RepID=UPI00360D83F6
MYDHSRFLHTMSELSARLVTPDDVDAALEDACARMVGLFDLAGVAMALTQGGELGPAAGHPGEMVALGRAQRTHGGGPGVEAFRTGEVLAIADLEEYAGRWPEWCAAARARGVGAAVGIPLRLGARSLGVVDLYAKGLRDWPGEDLEAAAALADLVVALLVSTAALREQEQLAGQLQHALDSRTVIEQAKGVVSARRGVSVDEAFELIRRHARNHQVTVRAVAEGVVGLGLEV